MSQKNQKRRLPPAPLKAFWSQKCSAISITESIDQGVSRKQGRIVALRERGLSLQEIADELDCTRLGVFRFLQKTLSRNDKLRLCVPL
jgi:hypothetical protein